MWYIVTVMALNDSPLWIHTLYPLPPLTLGLAIWLALASGVLANVTRGQTSEVLDALSLALSCCWELFCCCIGKLGLAFWKVLSTKHASEAILTIQPKSSFQMTSGLTTSSDLPSQDSLNCSPTELWANIATEFWGECYVAIDNWWSQCSWYFHNYVEVFVTYCIN